jgi:hypothetical protein
VVYKKRHGLYKSLKKYGHMKVHVQKEKNDEHMKAHILKKERKKDSHVSE